MKKDDIIPLWDFIIFKEKEIPIDEIPIEYRKEFLSHISKNNFYKKILLKKRGFRGPYSQHRNSEDKNTITELVYRNIKLKNYIELTKK